MPQFIQIGEVWINPKNVTYVQPAEGGCYVNFIGSTDNYVRLKVPPFEIVCRLSDRVVPEEDG